MGAGFPFQVEALERRDASGQVVESCSILTTTPNALLADVHDRMRVILSPEHYDWWLDPGFRRLAALKELRGPFDATLMIYASPAV